MDYKGMERCRVRGLRAVLRGLALTGLFALPAATQEDADLTFRTDVTPDYESYLSDRDVDLTAQIDAGEDVDGAKMALVLVKLGQIHAELDRARNRIDAASEDLNFQLEDLEEALRGELEKEDTDSIEGLLRALRLRFVEDRDEDFETRVEDIFDQIEVDNEEIGDALQDLSETLEDHLEEIGTNLVDLHDSDEEFVVTFLIIGGGFDEDDLFEVSRENIDDVDSLGESLAEAADDLQDALDLLEEAETADDNEASIMQMRVALATFDEALATVLGILDGQPFSVLAEEVSLIDELSSAADRARSWVADLDEVLGGRTFDVGDKVVRPVALIESRTQSASLDGDLVPGAILLSLLARQQVEEGDDREEAFGGDDAFGDDAPLNESEFADAETARLKGWVLVMLAAGISGISDPPEDLFLEFWSADEPEAHTFRGLFPDGLSPAMLALIGADMIVNANASREELDLYFEDLREEFEDRVEADPDNAEANAGLAIIRTYFLIADNHEDVQDVIEMAVAGDIAGIADRFAIEDFDYSDSFDSTRANIEIAREDEDMVFIILEKLGDDDDTLFEIGEGDKVLPMPLTGGLLGVALDVAEGMGSAATALALTAVGLLERAEESFELDLDPNLLDFTEAKSGLDFALAVELSNGNFLQITPEGEENLLSAGRDIEDQLEEFSEAVTEMRKLIVALDEQDDVELELTGMADFATDFEDFYHDVHADFDETENTTQIDGREVDLSAWFDEPPDSLLQRFIWYLDEDGSTDNTLGGLFPGEGLTAVVEDRSDALPTSFALEQNHPNPFNSETVFGFSITESGPVRLELYNLAGQAEVTLVEGYRLAGVYRVAWDGRSNSGEDLSTGVYLYRLWAGEQMQVRKMLLLR